MSTLLRTTNPGAAGEQTYDRRRPYVGQRVLYHARPGEGRYNRGTALADVQFVRDVDTIDLTITYAADDQIERTAIQRRNDQAPFNCWTFTDHDEIHYRPDRAKDIVAELEDRIKDLETMNLEQAAKIETLEAKQSSTEGEVKRLALHPPKKG